MVKPGDLVKAGDVLMLEDSAQAESELAVLKSGVWRRPGPLRKCRRSPSIPKNLMMDKYHDASLGNRQEVDYINAQRG